MSALRRKHLSLAGIVVLALALFAFAACKPREGATRTAEAVAKAAENATDSLGKLSRTTGEAIGIIKKKVDYVRLAYGTPEAETRLKQAYTLEEEREIGRALALEYSTRFGAYSNSDIEKYLTLVAAALCAYSDHPELPCYVGLLRTEEVQSFALPGGGLLVSLGALRACVQESDVAGLLAFLIAHSQKNFTLTQFEALYAEKYPQAALPSISKMEQAEFSAVVQELAQRQARNGCTVAEYRTCDRTATDLLVRLGYEGGGLSAYLERVQVRLRGKQNAVLPDFPVYKAREQIISERLAELSAPGEGRSMADRYRRECGIKLPASAQ